MANVTLGGTMLYLVYASIGGIVPALLWLWFWLQEDKLHPEPRTRIMLAFLGGMAAVPLVYPLEKWIASYYGMTTPTFVLWALVEEVLKFSVIWFVALRTRYNDEPIDAMEYMVTGALGFAALENALFIFGPLLEGEVLQGLTTMSMRFVGASLLHVVSSAVLGYAMAREFYKGFLAKSAWRIVGLIMAISLHAVFNLFIIYENGSKTFFVFGCVWVAALCVLILFEKIKKLAPAK